MFRFGHYVLFLVSIWAYCNFDKATPGANGCGLVYIGMVDGMYMVNYMYFQLSVCQLFTTSIRVTLVMYLRASVLRIM